MEKVDAPRTAIQTVALGRHADAPERELEQVHRDHGRALYRYALALTGSPEDADDVVQEVFAGLLRRGARTARLGNARAYLFAAVRNAAYSLIRSRQRESEVCQAMSARTEPNPSEMHSRALRCILIREAFQKLPVEQRDVLALKIHGGMTFREIAEAVGAPLMTVANRYRYGIAKLRELLGEEIRDG